jgi:hypothetical protein
VLLSALLVPERGKAAGNPDGRRGGARCRVPLVGRCVQRHRAGSRRGPVGGQQLNDARGSRQPASLTSLRAAARGRQLVAERVLGRAQARVGVVEALGYLAGVQQAPA